MPIYTYKCSEDNCEHKFEIDQRITENTFTECPKCMGKIKRIIVGTNFILKGEKWFKSSGEY
ncbi:MAG: zinc ribbon domain-containing protein [Proteobacteria bacterium]|nr:zinc ribbon domain-containing protein [Pseudomonadota bacterium]